MFRDSVLDPGMSRRDTEWAIS